MLVLTLLLAAVGFALLVIALITGSVVWAWICITVCIIGALLLLASALSRRDRGGSSEPAASAPAVQQQQRGRHSRP
ncbi:hypothetical protein [Antrihabitans cavernicola]|uniref:DUF2207 domain-containing protein n=1 Tax=Antrihabitans cavernicola TaxID=2495913 RepID=A0A5A7SCP5_9NOCA|nr:hypothetical protein [Spelaeibacter cavernicola]KAA0023149.1 hypothetical protein FOY51_11815 [Spelaeibacter cavernicola]